MGGVGGVEGVGGVGGMAVAVARSEKPSVCV